jgi:hypothetical protein
MKNPCSLRHILRYFVLIMPLLTLAACNHLPFYASKPHPAPSKSTQAEGYLLTQALTKLALEKEMTDKTPLKSHINTLNAYAAKKPNESRMAVLSIEYTLSGQSKKEMLLVPIPLSATQPKLEALQKVHKNLSTLPYTLHNLQVYYVTVVPTSQKFSSDASLLRLQLDEAQEAMLADATSLTEEESAQLHLHLVHA